MRGPAGMPPLSGRTVVLSEEKVISGKLHTECKSNGPTSRFRQFQFHTRRFTRKMGIGLIVSCTTLNRSNISLGDASTVLERIKRKAREPLSRGSNLSRANKWKVENVLLRRGQSSLPWASPSYPAPTAVSDERNTENEVMSSLHIASCVFVMEALLSPPSANLIKATSNQQLAASPRSGSAITDRKATPKGTI